MLPRLLINDCLISKEQMHCFDASYPEYRIRVRFIYNEHDPVHNLEKEHLYFIQMTNLIDSFSIGLYRLVNITHVCDGPIKLKTYYFRKDN